MYLPLVVPSIHINVKMCSIFSNNQFKSPLGFKILLYILLDMVKIVYYLSWISFINRMGP